MILSLMMIVRRSLRRHALSTSVTVLSAALAAGLVMSVFSISIQSQRAFGSDPGGFNAVLGARGSPTQLVLNSVYHLETSPGNIPWSLYEEVRAMRGIEAAIPYALGDNYRGWRIVGTSTELFEDFEYARGRRYEIEGRVFGEMQAEAVLGATAARELGLGYGDTFLPYHGLTFNERITEQHDKRYTIVGVMKPTNTPADRVIWIPIEGIFRMPGHEFYNQEGERLDADPQAGLPDEYKEISAVMLRISHPLLGLQLKQKIQRQGRVATLAFPIADTMMKLVRKLGWVNRVLEMVAYLVVAVAAGTLLARLDTPMNERRREFAILRALGARKGTVFGVIVLEASTIAALGALIGYLFYYAIMTVAAAIVLERTGVVLDLTTSHPALLWTPLGMVVVGALAGLLPAFKAYSTDVAGGLSRG